MNGEIKSTINVLPPFKRLCMTIGELPSSYLETMTYYESLVWLTKYLSETVIPTINNNAEAVKELQNLYKELQDYVNNYFENLDVQDEINNKLDEMVSDGTFDYIINNVLNATNGSLILNLIYRDSNEYIEGITPSGFIKSYLQSITTTSNNIILATQDSVSVNATNRVLLQEISKSTGNVLREATLNLNHANAIAYNEDESELYVASASKIVDGETVSDNTIIIVDYDTFTIKETVDMSNIIDRVNYVSYDNKNKKLMVGYGVDCYIMTDFETIDKHIVLSMNDTAPLTNPLTQRGTIQNCVLFDNKIYVTRFNANGICVFNTEGNLFHNYYDLETDIPLMIQELEAIAIEENGDVYIASVQTSGSDRYKYTMWDRTIFKTNLRYNGYKNYEYTNNYTSSLIMYVDKDTTNNLQLGSQNNPFSNIQQAIMSVQSQKKNISCIINLIGTGKNYGIIVAKGTPFFTINGNNNIIYGLQLQKQECELIDLTINCDTSISLVSESIQSNVKIFDSVNLTLRDISVINNLEEKKISGIYIENSNINLISCDFTGFENAIYSLNSDIHIKDGINVNSCDYYYYPRGLTSIYQPSPVIFNRTNPSTNVIPFNTSSPQAINFTYDTNTRILEFTNKNIESSSSGLLNFLADVTFTFDGVNFSSDMIINKTAFKTFVFINQNKTTKWEVCVRASHTNYSGIWTFEDPRIIKTDISTGEHTVSSGTMNITGIRTFTK